MLPVKFCCFTGHRPNRLPWGESQSDERFLQCKTLLTRELERAWQDGYRYFLCGMARGADLMWAETVLDYQLVHPDATLIAVIPCLEQTKGWPKLQIARYQHILDSIDPRYCILIQEQRTRNCMLRRDKYMVCLSQRIIALYDGESSGGTRYTLDCALKKKLEMVLIDPLTLTTYYADPASE